MNALSVTEGLVLEALREIMDPELNCNIIDLGLVYGIAIREGRIAVRMTLTTQGCPMHESIAWGVKTALMGLEGVQEADVEVVWDPPWHPSMMTDAGRSVLGMA